MPPRYFSLFDRFGQAAQSSDSDTQEERPCQSGVQDEQLQLQDDRLETACTACADMAAYTDHLERALEIEKKARYELQQTCMNSRQSKTLLKNGTRQRDVEVQQLRSEVRQKDAEIGQAREEILRYKRAISKPSKGLSFGRELDPEPEYAGWLLTVIPHLKDKPSGLQVNALVIGLSAVLVELLDEGHIFGYASSGNVAKATNLHLSMRDSKATWQQRKQWEF
ncbi:hypothetical protein KCU77_g4412, partial [Aureobasidium melanogenum]